MSRYSHENLKHIKPGHMMTVRYGSRGQQKAAFVRWSNSKYGILAVVQKYSVRARKFTKDVRIEICEILEA